MLNFDNQHLYNATYEPTPKALEFYASGLTARQRMLLGAVRSRKTTLALKEVSCHLHGVYPDWWNGYRYDRPTRWLVGTVKAQKTRDVLQKYLLEGDPQFKLRPFIHPDLVQKKYMANGLANAIDRLFVRHVPTGGLSEVKFASFSEGASALQSETLDGVHLDEAPSFDIYQEVLYRTTAFGDYKSFVLLTMWPERGRDELVSFFMNKGSAGESVEDHFYMHCSWSDNPSLSEEEKQRLRAATPDYLLDAREHGIPIFGVGKVFRMKESDIVVPAFEIPDHFALIAGVDPAATQNGTWGAVLLAYDRDNDIVYVVKDYNKSGITRVEHYENLSHMIPDHVPLVCDPGGGGEDHHTRESAVDFLRNKGKTVIVANKAKGKKEATVDEIEVRHRSSKFKIFDTCDSYKDQFRRYSRDEDGKIIKENDHTIDASFYALRELKSAVSKRFLKSTYHSSKNDYRYWYGE